MLNDVNHKNHENEIFLNGLHYFDAHKFVLEKSKHNKRKIGTGHFLRLL